MRSRLAAEDCKRIARISAEYCLFGPTIASLTLMRLSSQGSIVVSLQIRSDIIVFDAKFSSTPVPSVSIYPPEARSLLKAK